MKTKETFVSVYAPAVSVYLDNMEEDEKDEIAGMLRGLVCSMEGFGIVNNLTNERFRAGNPLRIEFRTAENARHFKMRVEKYFSEEILKRVRVKRRVLKQTKGASESSTGLYHNSVSGRWLVQ